MMIADAVIVAQIFEAAMLICFGFSWPLDILKQIRSKRTAGKSLAFMSIILLGYVSGMIAKFVLAYEDRTWPKAVTWLYLMNFLLVGVDILLYLHYSRKNALAEQA